MNDPRQIAATQNPTLGPTLGPTSLVLIALTALAVAWFVIQSCIPAVDAIDLHRQEMLPSGCVYALVAAGVWLATAIHYLYARFVARALIVIAATLLFGLLRDARPWPQSAADFSGLAFVQCMIFSWAGVPRWRTVWSADTDGQLAKSKQFGIADLAIATFVIALLLSFIARYSPSVQWWAYWMISAAVWIGGAVVTSLIAKGMTSNAIVPTLFLLGLSLAIAVAGTYAIGTIDSIVDRASPLFPDVQIFFWFYGRIVWGFWLTFAFIACFARISVLGAKSQ